VVLYDENKRLIAINEQTLESLGYNSIEEFKREVYDLSQLFVKKSGYLYEFKNFHWIDYVLTNSTTAHKAIIKKNGGEEFEALVEVNPLSGIPRETIYYLVTFKKAHQEVSTSSLSFQKPNLSQIAQELNLEEEVVEDFIKEYIKHSLEKVEEIERFIGLKNQKSLFATLHTLKGVAGNLRLKPAFETLSKIKKDTPIEKMLPVIEEFYKYINFLAKEFGVDRDVCEEKIKTKASNVVQQAAKELGLSLEEYQEYLKELINEIKVNLTYNNYNELRKLASFARNLYLQECARYLDQVNIHQDPELVRQCLKDLEELKQEPNPFIVSVQDLEESLRLTQIDKKSFVEIIEDLISELKALSKIKMKKEKFLKKVKQLKSIAESLRLNNLVLLLNNLISNYPLTNHILNQLEEAIYALERNLKQLQ